MELSLFELICFIRELNESQVRIGRWISNQTLSSDSSRNHRNTRSPAIFLWQVPELTEDFPHSGLLAAPGIGTLRRVSGMAYATGN